MVIKQRRAGCTDDAHVPTVIPIHDESPCKTAPSWRVVEPHLEGPPERVHGIVQALVPLVDAEFGHTLPPGAWLRGLKVADDEAVMTIAPDLACHGHAVASLAFDVMRRLLPDTDIYVGAAPQDEPTTRA
jgi:hypothetical protein